MNISLSENSSSLLATVKDDFDLRKIAESGQCFRFLPSADGENSNYTVYAMDRALFIQQKSTGLLSLSCSRTEFEEFWQHYFDFGTSYASIRAMIDPVADPFLYAAAEHGKGIRILRQDPWEMLISFIISQNRNIPAIQRSIELLCKAAGKAKTGPSGETFYCFPTPEDILGMSETALQSCKLGYRDKYVRAAAESVVTHAFDPYSLPPNDEEALQALMSLYGVGKKVASCVLLFGGHRLDSFPVDVWIKRILSQVYPDGFPFDRYRPYNGVFQQFLFAYALSTHLV